MEINYSNLGDISQKWVNILVPFSGDYHLKMSASELAHRTGFPQQTVSRYLNQLAGLNILGYEKKGRNKLFYLDTGSLTAEITLNLIENYKALKFRVEKREIGITIEQLLQACESIIVFGSYATETFHEQSDLDLIILGKVHKEEIKRLKELQVIDINEHYVTYNEFDKILKSQNPLSTEIRKNHIIFGNVPTIVRSFLEMK